MARQSPYSNWSRQDLYEALEKNCNYYGHSDDAESCKVAVFDLNWLPQYDYDGCTMVQDPKHPFPPCFLHDYAWFVLGGGKQHDIDFRVRCIAYGVPKLKAWSWFIGVRVAWLTWFKWQKRRI